MRQGHQERATQRAVPPGRAAAAAAVVLLGVVLLGGLVGCVGIERDRIPRAWRQEEVREVVDWRLLVVAVLVLGAHVAAVLLSYGPGTLPVDARVVTLWLRRALLALVPVPFAWLAVRGIDPAQAPPWLWAATAALTAALMLLTAQLVRSESSR